jgi:hypothetical protein
LSLFVILKIGIHHLIIFYLSSIYLYLRLYFRLSPLFYHHHLLYSYSLGIALSFIVTADITMTATSEEWDILQLYEHSVNSPKGDVDFLLMVFQDRYNRKAEILREDFCGTAGLACEWVGRGEDQYALGIDWDEPTLAWAKKHNVSKLEPDARERLTLQLGDVMNSYPHRVDVVAAHNFSWMMIRDRQQLREYFKKCHEGLRKEGMLVLDIYGGRDSQQPSIEETHFEEKGFTYHWQQYSYCPITNHVDCAIHFSFPDGRRIENAFKYEFRLWGLPELRDVLLGAHFREVKVFWEKDDGLEFDGNYGNFEHATSAKDEGGWMAYVIAYRS